MEVDEAVTVYVPVSVLVYDAVPVRVAVGELLGLGSGVDVFVIVAVG